MGSSGETCLLVPFSTAHSFYCVNKHYFPTFGKQLFWNNRLFLTFPLSGPTFSKLIVRNRTSTDGYKMLRYVVIPQEPFLERIISNQEEMQLPAINVIPNRRVIFLGLCKGGSYSWITLKRKKRLFSLHPCSVLKQERKRRPPKASSHPTSFLQLKQLWKALFSSNAGKHMKEVCAIVRCWRDSGELWYKQKKLRIL